MNNTVLSIAVAQLMVDPAQPRRVWVQAELDRLAASIAARGILQPLRVVMDNERKCWRIVTGESRWRAAKLAGLETVPCIPVEGELSEADILADQIVENHCRSDLKILDLARAMVKLKRLNGYTSQDLAAKLGISGGSVTKAEALLKLPDDVQAMVDDGRLPETIAYHVARLPDEPAMRELALAVATGRLKRDQVIDAVRSRVGKKNGRPKVGSVSGTLDGVSYTFRFPGEATPETLLKAIEQLRSKLKELQKSDHKDVSALPALLRA